MNSIDFSVDIEPVAWSRARIDTRGKRPVHFKANKLARYQKRIKDEAALAMLKPARRTTDGDVSLEITFSMKMPASWSKKKRDAMCGEFHTSKPDLDNLVKAVADACNGVIWKDDAQIGDIQAMKIWNHVGAVTISAEWDK